MTDRVKLVVLSDLHIVAEGALSHGLNTAERLRAGVAAINARHGDADAVLIAGDLADLGERAAYERLQTILADLTVPVHLTIGNHDDRRTFLDVFGSALASVTGYIDKAIDLGGHRIILLDTAIEPGRHDGRLEPSQLEWLGDRLQEAQGRPVIVVGHHHANPLLTQVDRIILQNGRDFVATLSQHDDIRQVIAGHVHYTSTGLWHGLPFTTLAGGHYNVTIPLAGDTTPIQRLAGPAQLAVILSSADQTLIHFDNYIDDHGVLPDPSDP